ncbi:MAG: hypothetical protein A2234_01620 [Elusimicrobia bacterium RIFOXYA2_FULL_58_8]|nr:MAG: hypothetical protein A2285_09765 [Elusimicrobia bacterium RIFOXYA12_FULL_57_11]OGS13973.1 MAG: hypothetical protein A2234_01620 [Elusimicrobia bacterium RIFOXYA2_FULL_58_8]
MKLFKQILVRIIFLPLILAAGLAATALVAAHFMITPEDLRSLVTHQFQELLQRPVQIEWAKLSATGDITIKGLRVVESGPETVYFLTADRIYANCRLLPLLRRRVEIGKITFIAPRLELVKNKDGRWNIGSFFSGYRKTGKGHSLNRIAAAEIKDGEVVVSYAASGKRYTFEHFNLTLNNFNPNEDTHFDTSMYFRSNTFKKPVDGRIYSEGTVNFTGFNWPLAEINGLRAELSLLNKSASFTGSMKNFRRPEIKLKAETQDFRSSELAYLFTSPWPFTAPRSLWNLNAVFTGTGTVAVNLISRPLNLTAEGTLNLAAPVPEYNFAIAAPPITIAALKRYTELPLSEPSGKIQARIKLTSKDGKPQLDRVFANAAWAGFRYHALSASDLNITALLSENLANSYITASDGKITMGPASFTNLKLKTEITKEELSLTYSGRLNKFPVKGKAAIVNPFAPSKTVYFTGYSNKLVFSQTKALILDIIKLRGSPKRKATRSSQLAWLKKLKNSIPTGYAFFNLLYKADHFAHDYMEADNFYVSAALKNISGSIEKLKGDILIKSGRGTFYDVEATSEKDRVFYIFSMPLRLVYKMNRMGALKFGYKLKDISFNAIGGNYSLNNGKVRINNFYMDGKEFATSATGWIDFSNETMNLKIYTISGKYYSMGSLPEGLTDASGKPALAFTLEGSMAKPVINMLSSKDSGRIIKEAAGKNSGINFSKLEKLMRGAK